MITSNKLFVQLKLKIIVNYSHKDLLIGQQNDIKEKKKNSAEPNKLDTCFVCIKTCSLTVLCLNKENSVGELSYETLITWQADHVLVNNKSVPSIVLHIYTIWELVIKKERTYNKFIIPHATNIRFMVKKLQHMIIQKTHGLMD